MYVDHGADLRVGLVRYLLGRFAVERFDQGVKVDRGVNLNLRLRGRAEAGPVEDGGGRTGASCMVGAEGTYLALTIELTGLRVHGLG